MPNRIVNFNAGPAALPSDVLQTVQDELLDYHGTGMSIMEMSHRSPEYDEINTTAMNLIRELMGLDDRFKVLFVGGGASTQFAMVPLNFLTSEGVAAYVETGSWSTKAIKEAQRLGNVDVVASSRDRDFTYIPDLSAVTLPDDVAYLHLTSNNTIRGTQFQAFPDPGEVPLICDMSSDICSRTHDFSRFSLIYAGAQKNLGPAGVTVVIIRDDLLARCPDGRPSMFDYRTHAGNDSLYNTPPAFSIYVVKLILEWIRGSGGLPAMETRNREKRDRLYAAIDAHPDFFRGTAEADSRSWMNVTFRLPSEELEKRFVAEAKAQGLVGLKGHRSVGGIRASIYNAMSIEGVDRLIGFMDAFRQSV